MNNTKFYELGLNEKILKGIEDMGFEEPSQIQAQVIPVVLEGNDVIGQAQTGTGKTLAFGAPMLNGLIKENNVIKGLVLTPTRELAIQVNEELVRIAKHTRIRMLPIYGGQSIDRQIRAIKKGIDIIVGTPGRVLDLIRRGVLDLDEIQFLVLDEADEMLNMGFVEDIEEIINNCNSYRHTLLFSATMPGPIKKIASKYMKADAKHVSIVKNTMTVSTVDQYYYEIKQKDRFESLCRILDVDEPDTSIIFCKTKRGVDELVESMQRRGYNVEGMHGDMNQSQRLNTLKKFKDESLDFLVATDVAARGIDVENVTHVINYDLPQDTESYVHRIGRTGRANKTGVAYTLVTAREYSVLKQIEKATKGKIKRKDIPTIDDIFNVKYGHILDNVKDTLEGDTFKRFIPLATELDDDYNLVDVAAALMSMVYQNEVSFDYTEHSIGAKSSYVRLFINVGRKDKLNPKLLLQFFNKEANIYKESVGDIDLLDKFSFVDVVEDDVDTLIRTCSGKKLCGRKVNIEVSTRSRKK